MPLFAPSLRQAAADQWTGETPWGRVTVQGRLTQTHRGILDAMFATALSSFSLSDDPNAPEVLLIDPYKISRMLGTARDYRWLMARLEDMRCARVDLYVKATGREYRIGQPPRFAWEATGGIVSEVRAAKDKAPCPGGVVSGDRNLLAVTLSGVWMQLMRESDLVTYTPLVVKVAALKSGVTQALARLCLTHQEFNMRLDAVLRHIDALGPDTHERKVRRVHQAIKDETEALADLGITIRNGVVLYKQHRDVWFSKARVPVSAKEAELQPA